MSCPICVFLSCSQLYLVTRRDVASLLWHQSRMFPFVYVINYFANRYFASRYAASRCFAGPYRYFVAQRADISKQETAIP